MLRNLVSDIDVDQLVEDAGALNALTALMDEQVRSRDWTWPNFHHQPLVRKTLNPQ